MTALPLSRLAGKIMPSPTLAMNQRAAELKAFGTDIIPLSLGEPDFDTPTHVKTAGIAAIARNFTRYTAASGTIELKKAIAAKLARENGIDFAVDQIVAGSGAKIVIFAALLSVLDPNDEVVVPAPYWVSYPDLVELARGVSVVAAASEMTALKITPANLRSALSERTRALIFNSPSNPSGVVYTAGEIQALANVLIEFPKVWIITDELYEHLIFDNHHAVSFAKAAPALADRVITINGFSKGYVMTGWRLGFAAGPKHVIASIADLLSQMHGSPSSIAQAAAIEALEGDNSFLVHNRARFQSRRDLVLARLAKVPGLSAVKPSGAFYVFVGCAQWIGRVSAGGCALSTDLDVTEALLEEAGVATVPGCAFGLSPFFRISFALDDALLVKAIERIEHFGKALS